MKKSNMFKRILAVTAATIMALSCAPTTMARIYREDIARVPQKKVAKELKTPELDMGGLTAKTSGAYKISKVDATAEEQFYMLYYFTSQYPKAKLFRIFKLTCKSASKSKPVAVELIDNGIQRIKTYKAYYYNSKSGQWSTGGISVSTVKDGKLTLKATKSGIVALAEVAAPKKAKSVTLNLTKASLDLKKNKTVKLTAKVSPSGASQSVTWSTSNKKVAKVKNGLVTAVGTGTAKITAKTSNGKTAKCTITVKAAKKTKKK